MPQSNFFLFSGDHSRDRADLLQCLDGYGKAIGLTKMDVDENAIDNVINSCSAMPWPHGIENASAFKKVGIITTSFAYYAPIVTPFPRDQFGELHDHQNAIAAYEIAKRALWNSTIMCPFRGKLPLPNKIYSSKHFWREFVSTLSGCNPRDHFSCVSLLFEALVYRSNPHACYTNLYGRAFPELVK